jgi:transcriptional adapter 3
MTEKSLF